jgi:carbon monoxide dehydrogenase subunit G
MAHYETTLDVPAAPETAFAYLADLSNATAWDPSIVQAERIGDGPIGVGSRFRVVVAFFGRRIELDYEIERHDAPGTVSFVGRNKSVERRDTVTVATAAAGSAVTYEADLRLRGALRLLDKGLQLQFTTINDKAAAALREQLTAR